MATNHAGAQIVADAYKRTRGPVAFLDESYQAPDRVATHRETFYIFTAVVVDLKDMHELRTGLREIADHPRWHTTDALLTPPGRQKTQDMLGYLSDGFEACVIAHQIRVDQDDLDAERARRSCYRELAAELASGRNGVWDPIDLFVLEERNQRNFRNKDRANHSELLSEGRIPRTTRLLQTSPHHERLLWLPDLVSSAYRRTITHKDATREMFDIIRDQVHFVALKE